MPVPTNTFKARLKTGETQVGLWIGLGYPRVSDILTSTASGLLGRVCC
ncbi:hypothetical protein [Ruegeria marina]|uniref:4-hydroxy-2-oxoheptanedioate aldolase n=1 Tax=Ruegeria marina TaxID=639004 RepID=A0A1G7DL02_9RHOB|nr:hypothetical protein [Ruegeria marina]SDE51740.1 4-hydroxy-2-oxoheptanedioate aldolase [Ruegeria marina]